MTLGKFPSQRIRIGKLIATADMGRLGDEIQGQGLVEDGEEV
jgi:hypothetical protein